MEKLLLKLLKNKYTKFIILIIFILLITLTLLECFFRTYRPNYHSFDNDLGWTLKKKFSFVYKEKDLYKDIKAAETLGTSNQIINKAAERISKKEFGNINLGLFTPLNISDDIQQAFAENAAKLGQPNPLQSANQVIGNIQRILSRTPLTEEKIPEIENQFKNLAESTSRYHV